MATKISVIVCTYNRANFISQAIESVLAQTYDNFEVIVIDDASTDDTQEILKKYAAEPRMRIVKNEMNLGISKSRNKGVSLAGGEYIAMLDSDDYWTDTEKLKKQAFLLDADGKIGIVGSAMTLIDSSGKQIGQEMAYADDASIRSHMLLENQFMQSTVLFRKAAFEKAGGYNEKLAVAEDFDLWLRIGLNYTFANLPERTICYRIHTNNASSNWLRMSKAVNQIIDHYRASYPNYWLAKLKSIARLIVGYLHLR